MDLKLLIRESEQQVAVLLDCEPGATVATVAQTLARVRHWSRSEPVTLSVLGADGTWTPLSPRIVLSESGLSSGAVVTLVRDSGQPPSRSQRPSAAVVTVFAGPDTGKRFTVPAGAAPATSG